MIGRCQGFEVVKVDNRTGAAHLHRCRRSGRLYFVPATEEEPRGIHMVLCCAHVEDIIPEPEIIDEPDCGPNWYRDRLGDIIDEAKSYA